jgi:inosine-uridine nucleoside N-ribohydrolase
MESHSKVTQNGGMTMHDPLTLGFVSDRTLLDLIPAGVDVETKGDLTRGMTVVERREKYKNNTNAMVAIGVNAEKFNDLWLRTVLG